MEEKQFINFNEIKQYVNVKEEKLFLLYLREVFKDLADRDESNKKKGIMKMIFFDYLKLPIFISEKLFTVFDKDKDGFLSQKEFIYGMNRLYNSNFDETVKLIFDILDFNQDNIIEKDDVKMILGLLPLKTDKNNKIKYKYQMESLEEIQEIINSTFDNQKTLSLEQFKEVIIKKKSDVFLQIICFLYQKKPFTESNISVLSTSKKANELELSTPQISKKVKYDNIFLPSPLQSSALSPAFQLLKNGPIKSPFSLSGSINNDKEYNPEISGLKGMVRYHNRNIPKNEDSKNPNIEEDGDEDVNKIIKNSENVYNSPSKFLKESNEKAKNIPKFSLFSPETKPIEKNEAIPKMSLNNEPEDKAQYENYIYKKSEGNKLKKYLKIYIIINQNIKKKY